MDLNSQTSKQSQSLQAHPTNSNINYDSLQIGSTSVGGDNNSATQNPPPKVDQKTFEKSLNEVYQFKQCISLKIKQLESAISRLKSLVLVYDSSSEAEQQQNLQSTYSLTSTTEHLLAMAADQDSGKQNSPGKPVNGDMSTPRNHSFSGQGSSASSPSQADLLELRTILNDIDLHLAVLKDVEERHAHICESYSQEIRVRDETLNTKSGQIMALSQELALQQAKINQLTFQNKKLESEINLVRNTALGCKLLVENSSATANSGSTTPIITEFVDNTSADDHYTIDLEANKNKETNAPTDDQKPALTEPTSSPNSIIANRNYEEMYYKLLDQYHQGVNLPAKKDEFKLRESVNVGSQFEKDSVIASSTSARKVIDIEEGLSKATIVKLEKQKPFRTQKVRKNLKENVKDTIDELEDVLDDDDDDEEVTKPFRDVERAQSAKTAKKVTIADKAVSKMARYAEENAELNSIKEEDDADEDEGAIEDGEKQALLSNFEKSKKFLQEHKIADKVISSEVSSGPGDGNELVRTSKSVYDHFSQMQRDLEKLLRSEERYRFRCQQLEMEMNQIKEAKEDDEYKLSEATYELDILKHNYDLEMESFGSAVTERESLIEKLQQKVEALKRKYMTLDERLQESINKEVGYKSAIEEAEGRVRYEQLQRAAVIDARVNELELKLAASDSEYESKTAKLNMELTEKVAKEKELQGRIEQLEESLQNLVISNSNGSMMGNGDNLVSVEDEFAYYKNRIDSLLKELDNEKAARVQLAEKHEDELKAKDKAADQLKEQIKKEKELFIREKSDFDTKLRKLAAKFKVKEREISSLQEKLTELHDKFKPRVGDAAANGGDLGSLDSGLAEQDTSTPNKSPEQMMAELVLQEMAISELRSKLENAEEHMLQINSTLQKERDRRRELESYYLTQIKNRNGKSKGLFVRAFDAITGGVDPTTGGQDEWSQLDETNQLFMTQPFGLSGSGPHSMYGSYHAHGPHHRNSTASLSLLIDETSGYNHQIYGPYSDVHADGNLNSGVDGLNPGVACSDTFFSTIGRLVRRQKNAFIFGSRKEKTVRISMLIYLILVHFYAYEYYFG